jgi:hypothetical protein
MVPVSGRPRRGDSIRPGVADDCVAPMRRDAAVSCPSASREQASAHACRDRRPQEQRERRSKPLLFQNRQSPAGGSTRGTTAPSDDDRHSQRADDRVSLCAGAPGLLRRHEGKESRMT